MKACQIRSKQACQNFVAPEKDSKYLRRRKRDVQEETDLRFRLEAPQHLRNQQQLIVVKPDDVSGSVVPGVGAGGELLIHRGKVFQFCHESR